MDNRSLSERDICTKLITPVLRQVRWGETLQIREEVGVTKALDARSSSPTPAGNRASKD
jgi:hypothetical protein